MKKLFLISMMAFVLAFTSAPTAKAIENPFPEGTFLLSAHLGFVPGVGVNVVGDYVLINEWWKGHFTVGGYVGVNTRTYNYLTSYDQYYSNFSVLPRATYGLNITNDFEVHAGVVSGLTLRTWSWEDDHHDPDSDIKLTLGTLVGCKYYLSDNFGLSAEMCYAGWECSYMNAGVTFKF